MPDELDRLLQQRSALEAQVAEARATSAELVPMRGEVPAVSQRAVLAARRGRILSLQQQGRELAERLRSEVEKQQRELEQVMAPLRKELKALEEQVWTVNLYLGRDEEIVLLADGAPAAADEQLVVRQEVLSMDEETAVHAESGGMDFQNLALFDEWIRNPEHLEQVAPERKSVVALVPRRRGRQYSGNPFNDADLNKKNRWTYFLIRNGEWLWRMKTDFVVGAHLVPASDAFTSLFVAKDGSSLVPGTREWDRAAQSQEKLQRHYMRVALILQGLIDRTTVFHPLPGGGIDLLNESTYRSGKARFLLDDERVVTDGRPGFYEWLDALTSQLRVGVRVVGAFHSHSFRNAGEQWGSPWSRDGFHPNDRISPRPPRGEWVDLPEDDEVYRLESSVSRYGGEVRGFTFRFARTNQRFIGKGWDAELRAPKTKGRCTVFPGDRFLIPIDLASTEDIRYYLQSRRNRHAYEDLVPVLRTALAVKEAEESAETQMRVLIADELQRALEVERPAAESLARELVPWWKLANKHHRALVAGEDPAYEGKAIRAIVAEARRRSRSTTDAEAEAVAVRRMLAEREDMLVIARRKNGSYLAFAPQNRTAPVGAVASAHWCTEYTATSAFRGGVRIREWAIPGARLSSARVLYEADGWKHWTAHADPLADLTDPELSGLVSQLHEQLLPAAERGIGFKFRNSAELRIPPQRYRLLGIVHDRKQCALTAYLIPEADPRQRSEPPTIHSGEAQLTMYEVSVRWKKSREGVVLAELSSWSVRSIAGRSYEKLADICSSATKRGAAVFEDSSVRAEVERRESALEIHNREVKRRRDLAWGWSAGTERAWVNQAEAHAYSRFLEDFADPGLWEGHRKTLAIRYPHHSSLPGSHRHVPAPSELYAAYCALIDRGQTITGMTVEQIIAHSGTEWEVPEDLAALIPVLAERDSHDQQDPEGTRR